METIWQNGQFKRVAQPVKIVGNSGQTVDQEVLENYATKEDLENATKDLKYNELNDTLEIK